MRGFGEIMDVIAVKDLAQKRESEQIKASQDVQDGLIEYVACMADVELPEEETGGETDESMVQGGEA